MTQSATMTEQEPWAETDADGMDRVEALVADATTAEGICNVHEGAGYYAERIIKRAIKQGSLCLAALQGSAALPSDRDCPVCNGDCAGANPPVLNCPMRATTPTAPVQDDDAERDLRTARCLRSYAGKYAVLHRDIGDDLIRGAEALEQRAVRLSPAPDTGLVEALDETGWLIEEDGGWGITHWIALVPNIWERGWYISDRDQPSPVRRVKDSNEALRFARKQDAEAFVELFKRFLLCPVVTEHCWPTALANAAPAQVESGK